MVRPSWAPLGVVLLLGACGGGSVAGRGPARPSPSPIAASAAARPAPSATFDAAAAPEVEARRPLLVHPTVNGHDVGWFVVDTGASGSVISPAAAAAAGMPEIEGRTVVGASTFEAPGRWCEELTLGPVRLASLEFTQIETAFMSPRGGPEVAGIVGADLFHHAVVEVDLATPAMRIFDPATYHLRDGAWEPIRPGLAGAAVQATVEGATAGWFLLDTGGEFGLAVDEDGARALGLLDGRPLRQRWSRGVGGMDEGREGNLSSLEIGGQRIEPAPFSIFGKGKLFGAREGVTGLIGWRALRRVIVVMDWARGRVAVQAREPEAAAEAR